MESINSFIDHLDGTSHSQVKKTKIESMNKFTGENEIINSQTGNFTGMAIASTHKNRDVIGTNDSRERERSLLNFYELIAGDITKSKNISLKNIKLREYKVRKENPKLFSRCEWKKIIDIFYRIENDYVFPLAKILNIFFNTQIHIRKKCSMSIDNINTFFKFLEILKKSYKCKNGINIAEIQLQNHLIFLYKEFREFQCWFKKEFKIKEICTIKNSEYSSYEYMLSVEGNNEGIISFLIETFCCKNFNVLFKIIPEFILVSELKVMSTQLSQRKKLAALRICQLILCKFEVFRYEYLSDKQIQETDLINLQSNEVYNETVAIIGLLLNELLVLMKSSYLHELEILNFIYFIRAKYHEYYIKLVDLQCVYNIHLQVEKISSGDNSYEANAVQIFLTDSFKQSLFYEVYQDIKNHEDRCVDNEN